MRVGSAMLPVPSGSNLRTATLFLTVARFRATPVMPIGIASLLTARGGIRLASASRLT